MGRKRKVYTDSFKYQAIREALKAGANRAEVAAKYGVAPSCLSEWIELFIDCKFETEEQKRLKRQIEDLQQKNELMLRQLGMKQLEIDLLKKNETFPARLGNL